MHQHYVATNQEEPGSWGVGGRAVEGGCALPAAGEFLSLSSTFEKPAKRGGHIIGDLSSLKVESRAPTGHAGRAVRVLLYP